ncbi:hypothetical protein H8356DRAFT_1434778 [Neocallimastix lanati (nom. inval.)]|nr:hypothetical protein H8356DRAFT_1434778 [Neocallimastix sp. JGI-2020a]
MDLNIVDQVFFAKAFRLLGYISSRPWCFQPYDKKYKIRSQFNYPKNDTLKRSLFSINRLSQRHYKTIVYRENHQKSRYRKVYRIFNEKLMNNRQLCDDFVFIKIVDPISLRGEIIETSKDHELIVIPHFRCIIIHKGLSFSVLTASTKNCPLSLASFCMSSSKYAFLNSVPFHLELVKKKDNTLRGKPTTYTKNYETQNINNINNDNNNNNINNINIVNNNINNNIDLNINNPTINYNNSNLKKKKFLPFSKNLTGQRAIKIISIILIKNFNTNSILSKIIYLITTKFLTLSSSNSIKNGTYPCSYQFKI